MHLRIQTTGTYSAALNSLPILEESKANLASLEKQSNTNTNTNVCVQKQPPHWKPSKKDSVTSWIFVMLFLRNLLLLVMNLMRRRVIRCSLEF